MPGKLISLGQILDHTWEFYTKHFRSLIKITLWLFLVSFLVILGTMLSPVGNAQFLIEQDLLTTGHRLGLALPTIARLIVAPILGIWVFLTLVGLIGAFQTSKSVDVKAVGKASWKMFIPYAVMSILRGLIFLVPVLTIVPGMVLILITLATETSSIGFSAFAILLTLIGALVGLVLTFLFGVWFAFPGYEMVLEGKGIIDSLKASKQLVHGRFWPVLWRILIPKMIFSIFIIIAQVGIFLIFAAIFSASSFTPETFVRFSGIIGNLVLTSIGALTLPLYLVADYFIFDSLKKN